MADEARIAQICVEIIIAPTDQRARVAQLPTEVIVVPTDATARIAQLPVEIVVAPTDAAARIAQIATEILREGPGGPQSDIYVSQVVRSTTVDEAGANTRVSQTTFSPIYETRTDIKISQVVLAVVRNNTCPEWSVGRRPDFMPMFLGYPKYLVDEKWEF